MSSTSSLSDDSSVESVRSSDDLPYQDLEHHPQQPYQDTGLPQSPTSQLEYRTFVEDREGGGEMASEHGMLSEQSFVPPSDRETKLVRLKMVVVWMVALPLLLGALYICLDLFRKQKDQPWGR